MKKVIEVNIGGVNFIIEDDAYIKLKKYLTDFEETLSADEAKEIMEDIEIRICELFQSEIKYANQVVKMYNVDYVINCLGQIESNDDSKNYDWKNTPRTKKLYRNTDEKKIAGVCSGLSEYFNIDVTLIRIIFIVAVCLYGSTLWIYIILWIVVPEAKSTSQKMEMKGESITAESLKQQSAYNKKEK